MSIDKKKLKTSISVWPSQWKDFGNAAHARGMELSEGIEEAIELWLGGQQTDPNAAIIRDVRSILARDDDDSVALRVVVDALMGRR